MSEQQFDLIQGVEGAAEGFAEGEAAGLGPEDPVADVLGVAGAVNGFANGATGGDFDAQLRTDAGEALNYITSGAPGDYNGGGAPGDYNGAGASGDYEASEDDAGEVDGAPADS